MKLPKRVPWSNSSELEQIFSWIYEDEGNHSSAVRAINRLSAWKASTALPHALESSLLLLTAILQDEQASSDSTPPSPCLSIRQSYALGLIRLVNGLVDPLQQGTYARSIADIAAQIGLPLWLVELRHASTHEHLPSLELLREGARDAMSWLLHNYFLPTLAPASQPRPGPALSPLSPLLARYKRLLKKTTRDVSLKAGAKPELGQILREIEQWIVKSKTAASILGESGEEEEHEKWALEGLSDALVGPGGLVPVSKRKRPSPSEALTVPTEEYIRMWSPFILHVESRHAVFPCVLLWRIVSRMSGYAEDAAESTFEHTLGTWALWIVDRFSGCDRIEVLKRLLIGLGRRDSRACRALAVGICGDDLVLRENVKILLGTVQRCNRVSEWEEDGLETMSARLGYLEDGKESIGESVGVEEMEMKGWRMGDGWRECPIGVLIT